MDGFINLNPTINYMQICIEIGFMTKNIKTQIFVAKNDDQRKFIKILANKIYYEPHSYLIVRPVFSYFRLKQSSQILLRKMQPIYIPLEGRVKFKKEFLV